MIKNLLPKAIYDAIKDNYRIEKVYEIRIRIGRPICINYCSKFIELLAINGKSIIATKEDIASIISTATNNSIYTYNDQIKHSYITFSDGIRIGLSGELVLNEQNEVVTVKNINGLVIRLARSVGGCSNKIMPYICMCNQVKNTLIISPPGMGKTTLLRDIAVKLSDEKDVSNVLVIDERYEIASCYNSSPQLYVGRYTDVISGCDKRYGFEEGIKVLRPSVIICDEISSEDDASGIKNAESGGVKVIASCHGESIEDIKNKIAFKQLLSDKVFDRFIVLDSGQIAGACKYIFDSNFACIYSGETL